MLTCSSTRSAKERRRGGLPGAAETPRPDFTPNPAGNSAALGERVSGPSESPFPARRPFARRRRRPGPAPGSVPSVGARWPNRGFRVTHGHHEARPDEHVYLAWTEDLAGEGQAVLSRPSIAMAPRWSKLCQSISNPLTSVACAVTFKLWRARRLPGSNPGAAGRSPRRVVSGRHCRSDGRWPILTPRTCAAAESLGALQPRNA